MTINCEFSLYGLMVPTRSFSWSLAASKGCEVADNDIHTLKSTCGHLADKIVLRVVTVPSTLILL